MGAVLMMKWNPTGDNTLGMAVYQRDLRNGFHRRMRPRVALKGAGDLQYALGAVGV